MKVFYSDYVLVPFIATWSMVQICIMLYPGRLKLSDFLVQVLCNLNIGSVCVCSFSVLMDTLNMMISSSRLHKKNPWLTSVQRLRAMTTYGLLQALF